MVLPHYLVASCLFFLPPALAQSPYESEHKYFNAQSPDHTVEFYDFVTRPDIIAPKWNIKVYNEEALAPGYFFISPYEIFEMEESDFKPWVGPHIYDQSGELIWSGAPTLNGFLLTDFRVSNVNGKDMLTGVDAMTADGIIMDDRYQVDKVVPMHYKDQNEANRHDFHTADNGTTVLGMTWKLVGMEFVELKPLGWEGSCRVRFGGFQEHDIQTLEVLFDWSSEFNIHLNESYSDPLCENEYGWDYLHVNSVDKLPDGDYILSARMTDAIYKISHLDGSVIWRIGGKQSDFKLDTFFSGQHDARVLSQNSTHIILSVLDNALRPAIPHTDSEQSRGIIYALDTEAMTGATLHIYDHPSGGHAPGRGNLQILENENAFSGWWSSSLLSEHSNTSELLMESQLVPELNSYRCYKFPWVGHPKDPPDVYAIAMEDTRYSHWASGLDLERTTTFVYVSWNGATAVVQWVLRHGETNQLLASTPRAGFETRITFRGYASHVVVEALDHANNVLGRSEAFTTVLMPPEARPTTSTGIGKGSQPLSNSPWQSVKVHLCDRAPVSILGAITLLNVILVAFVSFRFRRDGKGSERHPRKQYHD